MTKFEQLDSLLEQGNGYITIRAVTAQGISKPYFAEYARSRELERVAHGVYQSPDAWPDDMYVLHLRNSNIIFSHQSALALHGFREMERVYVGETFFVDQMSNCGTVELLHNGDYRVNEKYTFMIGDPLMDYERIKNVENAFAAIHGQPKSVGNKIPVWALGLCY